MLAYMLSLFNLAGQLTNRCRRTRSVLGQNKLSKTSTSVKGIFKNLLPYSNIKPRNLGFLLFLARVLIYLSCLILGVALILISSVLIGYYSPRPPVQGSIETYRISLDGVRVGFYLFVASIFTFALAKILAAVTHWESSLSGVKHEGT